MARDSTFNFRVDEKEKVTFEAMARMDKLSLGTFIRRLLLFEAERRGVMPPNTESLANLASEWTGG